MRLSKYFLCLSFITIIGLVYSHQHFLITTANYDIIKHEDQLSQLLDRNKKLMYNVTALESPANLESKLCANGLDYDVPRQWAVVRLERESPAYDLAKVTERRNAVFERILNLMATDAEAQLLE